MYQSPHRRHANQQHTGRYKRVDRLISGCVDIKHHSAASSAIPACSEALRHIHGQQRGQPRTSRLSAAAHHPRCMWTHQTRAPPGRPWHLSPFMRPPQPQPLRACAAPHGRDSSAGGRAAGRPRGARRRRLSAAGSARSRRPPRSPHARARRAPCRACPCGGPHTRPSPRRHAAPAS